MNRDFLDQLRDDARRLRYQPDDDVLWTRLAARVRDRVQAQPSVSQLLTRWFRPITAALAILALGAVLGVTWFETRAPVYTLEAIASNSVEISIDGDTFRLAE
jgi:hypothetical protein